jgi:16S rRNA (cytosine1402-N4)-methyltransferase
MQLDRPERGFSFMKDGPLDMRMGRRGPSAADVVNEFEPRALTRIIAVLGEERHAAIIARAITKARTSGKLTRTEELADVIERAIGRKPGDPIHPATRTFQALRIYVNNELDELADALAAAERILADGGRLVVVSFHSLEDRIVKRFIAERTRETPTGSRHSPVPDLDPASFRIASRGPVTPSDDEIARNPRARSAKLRAAIRTDAAAQRLDRTAIGVPPMPVMRAWA